MWSFRYFQMRMVEIVRMFHETFSEIPTLSKEWNYGRKEAAN